MDDLIYVLLVVGWVAFGIYSSVKKNKAKENPQGNRPASPQPKEGVEALFDSLFPGMVANQAVRQHPYAQQEEFTVESMDEEVYDDFENDYLDVVPEKISESKIDTYSGTDNVQSALMIEDDEEMDEIKRAAIDGTNGGECNRPAFKFDLRQAVISQAVLDRPYK